MGGQVLEFTGLLEINSEKTSLETVDKHQLLKPGAMLGNKFSTDRKVPLDTILNVALNRYASSFSFRVKIHRTSSLTIH